MQILIVALLAIIAIAVAPWLFGVFVIGAAAYGVLLMYAIGAAVLAAAAYAGYFFFIAHPREDRLEAERSQARNARLLAQDLAMAAQQASQKKAVQDIIDAETFKAAKVKAEKDAVQAEVDEQIREAAIRKALKAAR